MPKYTVSGIVAADCYIGEVEAANATEAIEKAWAELPCDSPSVCHQCAGKLNVGDMYKLIVCNLANDKDYLESE